MSRLFRSAVRCVACVLLGIAPAPVFAQRGRASGAKTDYDRFIRTDVPAFNKTMAGKIAIEINAGTQ